MWVCVCEREREGGREGGREGEREREREREGEGWFKRTVCEKSLMNENVECLDVAMYEEELSVLWFSGSNSQRSKNVLGSRLVCKSCCSKCSLHLCCTSLSTE